MGIGAIFDQGKFQTFFDVVTDAKTKTAGVRTISVSIGYF
jgi:hypothetical protein